LVEYIDPKERKKKKKKRKRELKEVGPAHQHLKLLKGGRPGPTESLDGDSTTKESKHVEGGPTTSQTTVLGFCHLPIRLDAHQYFYW